jgi:hypothetical protein
MKTKESLVNIGITEIKAEEIMLLESKMLEQAVKFQFKKKDGTIREAIGTLKRDLMKLADGSLWEPKGPAKAENPALLNFFDMEAQGWRCMSCANFVGMEG